jgi:hypothetical protein
MKRASFQLTRERFRILYSGDLWIEHILPFLVYLFLSIALTWPLIQHFTTALPGTWNDVHQSTWTIWHVKEAILGRQDLFDLSLIYFPFGATLLSSVPGPLIGLMALPFWIWGVEAAYNGAVLFGFVLTAYFMFRLARSWKMSPFSAFFAGLVLLVAPMHLAGMQGHFTKVFLGLLPLSLLCFHQAGDLTTSRRRTIFWVIATGVVLLMTALFNGLQLILIAMSLAYFALFTLIRTPKNRRKDYAIRLLVIAGTSAVLLGPLLLATVKVVTDPAIPFGRNFESFDYQPDLLEFLLPWTESRLLGSEVFQYLQGHGISPSIETAVSLPWLALGLSLIALLRVRRQAIVWGLFTFLFILLALGPSLKIFGRTSFTEYGLPVILPYSFFTALPGLDFLRTPGRMMMTGYVGLAMTAGFGLDYLLIRFSRRSRAILIVLVALLLIGQWPRMWDSMELRPVPSFYREIASEDELYGVFDLPITPVDSHPAEMYSAYYQMYQMVHNKGIATGYISRSYNEHPVFPCLIPAKMETVDILLDGEPVSCDLNTLYELAENGYRYVVFHKPSPDYELYTPGSWGEQEARRFIDAFLADEEPLADDNLAAVYQVPDITAIDMKNMIRLGANWYAMERSEETHWRWARSPASVDITSDLSQEACLEITPTYIYDPDSETNFGDQGQLSIESDDGLRKTVDVKTGETLRLPITLQEGDNELALSLGDGNFQPGQFGSADTRWLSFAIHQINLQTGSSCS